MQKNIFELLWTLAKTDFKLRYHGSILGFLWVLFKPLSFFFVLNFVFSNLFQIRVNHYSLRLFTAIVLWHCFSECTGVGLTSLSSKSHLITNVNTPKWVVVQSSVTSGFLTFFLNCGVLAGFFLYYGVYPSLSALAYFLFLVVMLFALVSGFSLLTAPFFLRLRDLNQIWDVILVALIYLTPVFYPITALPESIRSYLYLNPMTPIIEFARLELIDDVGIPLEQSLLLLGAIGAFFAISVVVFKKSSLRSSEYV